MIDHMFFGVAEKLPDGCPEESKLAGRELSVSGSYRT